MKTYKGNQMIATYVDGHKVFIKLQTVRFNNALVSISVYHRKGQQVSIKFRSNPNFCFHSEAWDLDSSYALLSINTRPYNHTMEMLEDVLNTIENVIVFIDFDVEDRVYYELTRALLQ